MAQPQSTPEGPATRIAATANAAKETGMRKRILPTAEPSDSLPQQDWLPLETLAQVEVTSEDPLFPVESALVLSAVDGWRAAGPGSQTIRLLFDEPLPVRRIHLEFVEKERDRTQEFSLRWSPDGGRSYREIVRQQFNFSSGASMETENYEVNLERATVLELIITPHIGGGDARASLRAWRVG